MIRPIPEVSIQAVPPVLHLIPKLFGPQRADGWRAPAVGRVAWVNGQESASPSLPMGCGITITKIAFPDKLALVDRLRRASTALAPRR